MYENFSNMNILMNVIFLAASTTWKDMLHDHIV